MQTRATLIIPLAGVLAACVAVAQISISRNPDGTTTASLAGQITVPKGLGDMFATIDNKTFTCSLVRPVKDWVDHRLKDGDVLAAMVSGRGAIAMDTEGGLPILAIMEASDGASRVIMPAVLKFKIDIKGGALLHLDGYDIEARRPIRAGDSIPVLYIGNGPVLLSLGETDGKPWISAFHSDSKNRTATISLWRSYVNRLGGNFSAVIEPGRVVPELPKPDSGKPARSKPASVEPGRAIPELPKPETDKLAEKKTAFDKPTFEAYVRHLNVWNAQIKVDIADPKPSDMPGFSLVNVHASAGGASADFQYYVSKDGQKVVQGNLYDISQNPFKADLDKLKTDLQPSFGTPGAPVVLVEFSDFECPMCKEEAKMLRDNLLSTYPQQVRFYFMEFPLDQIHPWGRAAAIAGRCIFRQNAKAFWDYHDWIFAHQDDIKAENLKDKVLEFAKGKEIDALQLTRCMDNKETEAEVNKAQALGKDVGVGATPTLFINGRKLVGRVDWPSLRNIIDYEIDYQKTAHNAGENCGCEVSLPAPKLN